MSASRMLNRLISPLKRSSSKKLDPSSPTTHTSPSVKLRLEFTDSSSVAVSLVPGRQSTSEAGELAAPAVPAGQAAEPQAAAEPSRSTQPLTCVPEGSGAVPATAAASSEKTAQQAGFSVAQQDSVSPPGEATQALPQMATANVYSPSEDSQRGVETGTQGYRDRLQLLLPRLQDKAAATEEEWWLDVAREVTGLQESSAHAAGQVERLGALEAQVAQLQNVLEVVCAELEAGHKTTQALEKRAVAAEGALERANARAQTAEVQLAQLRHASSRQQEVSGTPRGRPHAANGKLEHDAEFASMLQQADAISARFKSTQSSPGKAIARSHPASPHSARKGLARSLSPFAAASPALRTYNSFSAATMQHLSSARSQPETYGMFSLPAAGLHAKMDRLGSAPVTGLTPRTGRRETYGSHSEFQAVKESYHSTHSDDLSDSDKTQRWLRGITSARSAVEAGPKQVDRLVRQLQGLCLQHGLDLPLKRTAACTYALGSSRLSMTTINGKLMVRRGGGYEPVLSVIEKVAMPVHS